MFIFLETTLLELNKVSNTYIIRHIVNINRRFKLTFKDNLMSATLYYIHDPMCSWCWGYKPVWDALQKALPKDINLEYVAGGLAPDSNDPMPVEQQKMIKAHWHTIAEKLGTQFNFGFWHENTPRRSTYNACRAVIAAKKQSAEQSMITAIQQGYYLHALNPSDNEILIQLAREVTSDLVSNKNPIDVEQFTLDLNSNEVQAELMRQIQLSRELTTQGFPSLVLEQQGQCRPIIHHYHDYKITLADIMQ